MNLPLVGGLLLAAALLASGWDAAQRALPAAASDTPVTTTATHELGRQVYNYRCYFCHGYSGDARTLAATYLHPRPRDFKAASPEQLGLPAILAALREGRPGTAMKSFRGVIPEREIEAVAAFVAREFVRDKAVNTHYHTAQNGWPDHDRHAAAFPFARGEIALDTAAEQLDPRQVEGRRLFMRSCVSCHDRARVEDEGPAWSARPVSWPRMGFVPGQPNLPPPDVVSSASVYARHEVVPRVAGLTRQQRQGERLFQANCAFCHGGDGTGRNWIGQFMEPKARDLTAYDERSMPRQRLREVLREGLPGTSMPAWKSVLTPAEIDAVAAYVSRVLFRPAAG